MPTKNSRICSAYFVGGQKSEDPNKDAYNPTIFPPQYKKCAVNRKHLLNAERTARLSTRKEIINSNPEPIAQNQIDHSASIVDQSSKHQSIQTDFYEPSKTEVHMPSVPFSNRNESMNENRGKSTTAVCDGDEIGITVF